MNILKGAPLLFVVIVAISSCQKNFTIDSINPGTGSLKNDVDGGCLSSKVNGTFKAGAVLTDSNTIDIQVDVTTAGSYTISTDTINGYYFTGSGFFSAPGVNTISLKGKGTPFGAGSDDFTVFYNNTHCDIIVPVLSFDGNPPADFTLGGAGASCSGAIINGTYTADLPLTSDNYVTLEVDVATEGSYTMSTTPVNGMTFSGSGTFTSTGSQTVILTGSGSPTTAGNTNVTITEGSSSCTYTLTVLPGAAVFTLKSSGSSCSNANVLGSYLLNTPLEATNLVTLDVDVSTAGNWSVLTVATNGMTFSGSGVFSATGAQTITLQGSGIPAATGPSDIPVSVGGSDCKFMVTVSDDSTPSCNPADNTADLSGVTSITFTYVTGAAGGGSYTINGSGQQGDVVLEFADAVQPSPGVYKIQSYGGDFNSGDVHVSFTASDIYWQCSSGLVHVSVANGKVTALFCDIEFSGSLGGPSFHTNASAKITELF